MKGVRVHDLNVAKNGPNHYVRDHYPRPSQKDLQKVLNENYTSLLIIRDPFERLLSAYKDKIESTSNDYFNPFICNISKSKKDAFGNCRATFPDFVDFIISEQEEGRQPNEHWATYDEFCSPCQVRFDYVLKFEHLDVEEPFFISQSALISYFLTYELMRQSLTEIQYQDQLYLF
ncbi:Carbohydrate sulfotransferase 12 [Armadillidium nasatum]|uniref:Carbohydrate sulfotransferase n=1 Tax=Armadillidium nasatum TaxID=96803 RepID=A0A5N5SJT8_9CRUS|nr:Carbohydrate sulfotransferase 12 [Armadillidium nasatum]